MALKVLLKKEVLDLIRDPRIFIPFIISALILPAIGFAAIFGVVTAIKEVVGKPTDIAIIDLDRDELSKLFIDILKNRSGHGIIGRVEVVDNVSTALKRYEIVIVIPKNFTKSVKEYVINGTGTPKPIVVIQKIRSLGMGVKLGRGETIVRTMSSVLSSAILNVSSSMYVRAGRAIDTVSITFIEPRKSYIVTVGPALGSISMAMMFLPIIVILIGSAILQMSATSMAVENEAKTLETLLTLPIKRSTILWAKLLGSFIVALIGSSLSLIGFAVYVMMLMSFTQTIPSVTLNATNATMVSSTMYSIPRDVIELLGTAKLSTIQSLLIPSTRFVPILIASAVITLLFLAALGVFVGALCSDVRIAGTITGIIVMPLFILIYMIMFIDPLSLSSTARAIFLSIPLIQLAILAKLAVFDVLVKELLIGIPVSAVITILIVAITAKIMSIETLTRLQMSVSRIVRRRRAA